MLNVITTHKTKQKTKIYNDTFGGDGYIDGYIYYLDGGDGFTGVCTCPNSSNSTPSIRAVFIRQLNIYKEV